MTEPVTVAADGPFKIELKVLMVGESGEYEGYDAWADIELAPGVLPTQKAIENAMRDAMLAAPEGFELPDRKQFVNKLLQERTGQDGLQMVIPGLEGEFNFSPSLIEESELQDEGMIGG